MAASLKGIDSVLKKYLKVNRLPDIYEVCVCVCGVKTLVHTKFRNLRIHFRQQNLHVEIIGGSKGGARDARPRPLGSKFFHFHAVFSKNLKNNSNFGSWRTPLGKILDPPLEMLLMVHSTVKFRKNTQICCK